MRYEDCELEPGKHEHSASGVCVVELAALLSGEGVTDHPHSVSPVIGEFLRTWNDTLDRDQRQRLKSYSRRVAGTRKEAHIEARRQRLVMNWLQALQCAWWLQVADMNHAASRIRELALADDYVAAKAFLASVLHELSEGLRAQVPLDRVRYATGAYALTGASGCRAGASVAHASIEAGSNDPATASAWIAWLVAWHAAGSAFISPPALPDSADLHRSVAFLQSSGLHLLDTLISGSTLPRDCSGFEYPQS